MLSINKKNYYMIISYNLKKLSLIKYYLTDKSLQKRLVDKSYKLQISKQII